MSRSLFASILLVLSPACRFGDPGGSATDLVEFTQDASMVETGDEPDDESDPPPDLPPPEETPVDTDPDASVDTGSCQPSTPIPGCDPVLGTNCTPGINQCVVDPGAAQPSGRCVFPSAALGTGCDENGLYTTCPTGFTCKQGECRKYCYCDTDCDQGDTCGELSGQGTSDIFKLCLATRP